MAGFLTTAQKLALLRAYFGAQALTVPATFYVGALTTAPAADGTGSVEVSAVGTAYARVAVTNNAANFPPGAGASVSNGNDITFAEATALWGDVVGIALYESAVAATPVAYAPAPKTIAALDRYYVAAGTAVFEFLNAA